MCLKDAQRNILKMLMIRGMDGWGVRSTCWSYRGPSFRSQYPCQAPDSNLRLQLQRIQISLLASIGTRHTWGAHACRQNTDRNKIKINKYIFKTQKITGHRQNYQSLLRDTLFLYLDIDEIEGTSFPWYIVNKKIIALLSLNSKGKHWSNLQL